MKNFSSIRAQLIGWAFALTAMSSLAVIDAPRAKSLSSDWAERAADQTPAQLASATGVSANDSAVPLVTRASPPTRRQAPTTPADPLIAYRGLGAWVDLFDYGKPGNHSAATIVDDLGRRAVKTLYVQTSRWNLNEDIYNVGAINEFIDRSHAQGIRVVGWYLPGFGDIDRDLRGSLAVISHRTTTGQSFDGFAPDIEDKRGVGNDVGRFNAELIEYSARLRASVPPDSVLGGIVPDAVNNERAPRFWADFPWPEMAAHYDVILPMSYWTAAKPDNCQPHDSAGYTRRVAVSTTSLMGIAKPMHLIGGVADCISAEEVPGFVTALKEMGAIGGSLYDWETQDRRGDRDFVWAELAKVNRP